MTRNGEGRGGGVIFVLFFLKKKKKIFYFIFSTLFAGLSNEAATDSRA